MGALRKYVGIYQFHSASLWDHLVDMITPDCINNVISNLLWDCSGRGKNRNILMTKNVQEKVFQGCILKEKKLFHFFVLSSVQEKSTHTFEASCLVSLKTLCYQFHYISKILRHLKSGIYFVLFTLFLPLHTYILATWPKGILCFSPYSLYSSTKS